MNKGRVIQSARRRESCCIPRMTSFAPFSAAPRWGFRLLDFVKVGERMRPGGGDGAEAISADASLKEALNLMLEHHITRLRVEDGNGAALGEIDIADIIAANDAN